MILGGALVWAGVALDRLYARRCEQRVDEMLDESLDGTYPASDPTATQDFSAPEERRATAPLPTPGRLH